MRIKIYIISGVFLVVLCFTLYFWLGIFTPYNYFSAKADIKEGIVQVLIYGELGQNEKLENEIAKKYKFQNKRVAGCTVSSALINGINSYNRVVYDYLNSINEKGWREKMDKEFLMTLDKK